MEIYVRTSVRAGSLIQYMRSFPISPPYIPSITNDHGFLLSKTEFPQDIRSNKDT